jgi:hypothetical protein
LLQYPEPQGNANIPAKVSLPEKTAKVSPLPARTSPNQANTSNGTDFPRKTYPESSPPSVESVNEPSPQTGASWTTEYAGLDAEIKVRHYSPKTLKTYRQWMRRFQAFTRSKSPESLSPVDVKEFLTFLAVKKKVSASTQNQAFNALLFFFRHVLHKEFGKVEGVVVLTLMPRS